MSKSTLKLNSKKKECPEYSTYEWSISQVKKWKLKTILRYDFLPVVLSQFKKEQTQSFLHTVEWNGDGYFMFGKKFGKSRKILNVPTC